MWISDYIHTTSFYLGRFQKKLGDDQCSSITKGSIYHIKYMSIQFFTMEVDSPEIGCLMEESNMFDIWTYCVFTLYGKCITHVFQSSTLSVLHPHSVVTDQKIVCYVANWAKHLRSSSSTLPMMFLMSIVFIFVFGKEEEEKNNNPKQTNKQTSKQTNKQTYKLIKKNNWI